MSEEMSKFDQQLIDIASSVVTRWGVSLPGRPKDPKKAVVTALKQAISVAKRQEFTPVYANDHSWSSTGFRPLTVERLKLDDQHTGLSKAQEEWGVYAVVEGFDNFIVVPIAADLSEDSAIAVRDIVSKTKSNFLDLDEAPSVLRKSSEVEDSEIFVSVRASRWEDVRDLAQDAVLPLSEAVFFRIPVSWDILRARLSGAGFPPLPVFSEDGFKKRINRSVKFDRRSANATVSLLKDANYAEVDLNTPSGRNWFMMVADALNSLGVSKPMEGLSVVMNFDVHTRDHGYSGKRTLCVGYGLDPVQASYLWDLVADQPSAFHDLDMSTDEIFVLNGVAVIPDMALAASKATLNGRDDDTYSDLVEKSKSKRKYLNA